MAEPMVKPTLAPWSVSALLQMIADNLQARFNPVAVQGEISGFSRATSGHCYFSIKDAQGQIRCALFRRAAGLLGFEPRDGQQVQLRGCLGVYEPRGELQLVVESMQLAGQGAWFEQFLRLKARLQAQGLFDVARKRPLPVMPQAIGVVTSLGAAALHDVLSVLQQRAPHVRIVIYPASVQGAQAPEQLCQALQQAYQRAEVDVLLLVRGGGAAEDLWAFNDEALAHLLVRAPMPVVSGVGHESDLTIADFCADLRAATPTAAAQLCVPETQACLATLLQTQQRLQSAVQRRLHTQAQRLDTVAATLSRPAYQVLRQRGHLEQAQQRLRHGLLFNLQRNTQYFRGLQASLLEKTAHRLRGKRSCLEQAEVRLQLLDPKLVLARGYAWLADKQGQVLSSVQAARPGQTLCATLADGTLDVTVTATTLLKSVPNGA